MSALIEIHRAPRFRGDSVGNVTQTRAVTSIQNNPRQIPSSNHESRLPFRKGSEEIIEVTFCVRDVDDFKLVIAFVFDGFDSTNPSLRFAGRVARRFLGASFLISTLPSGAF